MEKPELLCRVDFPLYQAVMVSPRHILFAGGGGAAKTGVKNGFEIFEISHNGISCVAESVVRHETNKFSVMNAASSPFDPSKQETTIALGQSENCHIFTLSLTQSDKCSKEESKEEISGLRRRNVVNGSANNNNNNYNNNNNNNDIPLTFEVSFLKSFQTDFNMPEPYQKVVKMSPDMKFLATGGDDGFLRIWTFPECDRAYEIEAHEKEIDDLDFSPDSNKLVTISKDRRGLVWDVKKGKKHAELSWKSPNKARYTFKRIRFGKVEGDSKKYKLFTIVNPFGNSKSPSYLQRWDAKTFIVEQAVSQVGSFSALAVSDNGHFIATGAMFNGTVDIYTAFNLKLLKRVEKSHSTFITGLEFLPTSEESAPSRGFSEASVVSISVDHNVCIHHIPRLRHISVFWATILVIFIMFGVFFLCSYLGI